MIPLEKLDSVYSHTRHLIVDVLCQLSSTVTDRWYPLMYKISTIPWGIVHTFPCTYTIPLRVGLHHMIAVLCTSYQQTPGSTQTGPGPHTGLSSRFCHMNMSLSSMFFLKVSVLSVLCIISLLVFHIFD